MKGLVEKPTPSTQAAEQLHNDRSNHCQGKIRQHAGIRVIGEAPTWNANMINAVGVQASWADPGVNSALVVCTCHRQAEILCTQKGSQKICVGGLLETMCQDMSEITRSRISIGIDENK